MFFAHQVDFPADIRQASDILLNKFNTALDSFKGSLNDWGFKPSYPENSNSQLIPPNEIEESRFPLIEEKSCSKKTQRPSYSRLRRLHLNYKAILRRRKSRVLNQR